jgi:two-component system, chemotaxis family, CheB/CheR fusion protein
MADIAADSIAVEPPPMRVVGIAGAAGGLAALATLIRGLPGDAGLAIVVATHGNGTSGDGAVGLLQSRSAMPVVQIADGTPVEANHVYVAPSGSDVILLDGVLHLMEPEPGNGARAPADRLFRSLASAGGKDACCIVLSGAGSDGTIGLKRIKEHGGLTVAQDPDDAEVDEMPRSAIQTGLVDLVLPAATIPRRLLEIVRDPEAQALLDEARRHPDAGEDPLREILTLVRVRSGHDFNNYKRATLLRRVSRRMQVTLTETVGEYLKHLREHPTELAALLRDFLISVTSFFRDAESWRALDRQVLPRLFAGRGPSQQIRIWIAGCATGEEAYSLAIFCAEHNARLADPVPVQIFATDIDEDALAEARAGRYPDTIGVDVSAERLERFFTIDGSSYRVSKEIRETVMFSSHNVLRDPPFSRLDLITCRNLLIYLNREAQDRVLGVLHFGLRPDGHLMLGSSESAESATLLFSPVDVKHRIYARRPAAASLALAPVYPRQRWLPAPPAPAAAPAGVERTFTFGELHHKLVEYYAPPSVLIGEDLDVLHVSERAGRYLTVGGGEPTRNLLRLVPEDLRLDLRAAIYGARLADRVSDSRTVRTTIDGVERIVEIKVRAFTYPEVARGTLLVMFDERPALEAAPGARAADAPIEPMIRQLEVELHGTRDQLRTTVEQYETTVEELKASNEELQAINEELRSATEELETSKEELQSVNEELTTLNHELKDKIDEVSRANSDLQNLITSTELGVLFLDRELNVKRFTPRAQDLFNVIPGDVGRPFAHLTHKLDVDDLSDSALEVLTSLRSIERSVRSKDGRHYVAGLHPYRSVEDRIEGVVMTFLDVTQLKIAEQSLAARDTMLHLAERAADAGVWELEARGRRLRMSDEGFRLYGLAPAGEIALDRWLGAIHQGDRELVAQAIQRTILAHEDLSVELRVIHPNRGLRWLWITGRPDTRGEATSSIAGITIDVTERRRTEAALRASEERFRLALRTAPVVILAQDRELRYTWGYMLGGPVEFIGKTDVDLFPPAEAALLSSLKRAVLAEGVGRRQELALTIGGELHYYDFNLEPIRNDGGQLIGVSSAAVDVTASKLGELALRDADRRKDEFLATLAHELRNPLAPLQAALDIQHLAEDDLPRIARARAIMERQVAQIVRLVDDLLDVARITEGKVHLRFHKLTVQAVIDAAVEESRPAIDAARQRLVIDLPDEPIALEADYTRMTQVVANLLSNASKYSAVGGTITLSAGVDLAGTHLVLRVKDDGSGISAEMLPHVFDLFAQADDTTGQSQGGLGIGLALVRRLVELHGGTVDAHSEGAGQGSELVVRMPLAHDLEHEEPPAEPRVRVPPGTARRVLVVDDNRDVAESISELITMLGHTAERAHDGPSALAAFTAFAPDLVLLDIGLPGMNGYEVARRIRGAPRGAEVAIVAVTGWGQPADRARSRDAGFDHHLVKPAALAALREVVGDATEPRDA